jgi:RHS repeat-associated protein
VARAANNQLVLGYDALGRRISDYDSFDQANSQRNYTYLPNGQLGSIVSPGKYSLALFYDEEGRPLTMTTTGTLGSKTYLFYYDDADRLIALRIGYTDGSGKIVFWHYHYLALQPIGATREVTTTGTVVKRFWFTYDERGLIHQMLDNQGVSYFSASWDASGWRTLQQQGDTDVWVPFGLANQVILTGTEASAAGSGYSDTRPAIAINDLRAYDPLTGGFLSPDPADVAGRRAPEGYVAARNSPLAFQDPDGASASAYFSVTPWSNPWFSMGPVDSLTFTDSCSGSERQSIMNATADALRQVMTCTTGACGFTNGEEFRRHWLFALANARYSCPKEGDPVPNGYGASISSVDNQGNVGAPYIRYQGHTAYAISVGFGPLGLRGAWISPAAFQEAEGTCLSQTLAHEAFHAAEHGTKWFGLGNSVSAGFFGPDQPLNSWAPSWDTQGPNVRFSINPWSFHKFARRAFGGEGDDRINFETTGRALTQTDGCVQCR